MSTTDSTTLKAAHFNYILHLADTALILSQRICQWCGHGPVLEQDIALSNVGLDLLGLTRNLYQYASTLDDKGRKEDDLAYLRNERQFKNLLLVEQENHHFGYTVLRQFLFDSYQILLLDTLKNSTDKILAAIAQKSLIETQYHFKWSAEWVIRLGDGTEESHQKMQQALDDIWTYTGELFLAAPYEQTLIEAGMLSPLENLKTQWHQKVATVLQRATLNMPDSDKVFMQQGGKNGIHTEHLGYILAEMQYLQRQYPGLEW